MTTEEKAKAYDKALGKAKELFGSPRTCFDINQLKGIFPQLRESEDERTRNEIIAFIEQAIHKGGGTPIPKEKEGKWLAYLEKQKEEKRATIEQVYEKFLNSDTLKSAKENKYIRAQVLWELMHNGIITEVDYQYLTDDKRKPWTAEEYRVAYQKGFEMSEQLKQKKQNCEDEEYTDFTIYHPLKNGSGKYECIPYSFYGSLTSFSEDKDLIDFFRTCFYTKEECNKWIEQQKEQNPKIIIPKFHIGEYIKPKPYNEKHLIKSINEKGYVLNIDFIVPFKDEDVWEVVEQKPAEDKAFEEWIDDWWKHNKVNNPDSYDKGNEIQFDERGFKNFCRGIRNMYANQELAEWSEEDERMLKSVIWHLRYSVNNGDIEHTAGQLEFWLKSLRLQPKAKLTLLDENIIKAAVAFIEQNDHFNCWGGVDKHTVIKALRSLKPHWKPSEEQMEILGRFNDPVLKSLCSDLKYYFSL